MQLDKSKIFTELLALCRNAKAEDWQPYYHFLALEVPYAIIEKDDFLLNLYKFFPFRAGILWMKPMTIYNWHVDSDRQVAINMPLKSHLSYAIFTNEYISIVNRFQLIPYQTERYFLLDTTRPHAVINTVRDRYMFSVEFHSKTLTYNNLRDFFINLSHNS